MTVFSRICFFLISGTFCACLPVTKISAQPEGPVSRAKMALRTAREKHHTAEEISSLNNLAVAYWQQRSYDSARFYTAKALAAGANHRIDSLQGDSWMILGIIEHSQERYAAAMEDYGKSLLFYRQNHQLLKISKAYLNIGKCMKQIARYKDAVTYCLIAARGFERLKDENNLAHTYNSIALCFISLTDYQKAIEYNRKALMIRRKQQDAVLLAQSLNNLGFALKMDHQTDSAIFYLSQSISLYQKKPDSGLLVLPLQNLGSAWGQKGDFAASEAYILRSLRIADQLKMTDEQARGQLDLAALYLAKRLYQKALDAANVSRKIAVQKGLPEVLSEVYDIEMEIYQQEGDFKNAFWQMKNRDSIKDSLFTVAKNKTIEELDIQYQTDQRLKDIAALNTQNSLQRKVVKQQTISITALAAAAILLFVLLVVAYYSFRTKTRANKRIQTLMQDLHHRVKNNLQMLGGLFLMQIESMSDEAAKDALRENETRLASMNLVHHKLYTDDSSSQIEVRQYLTDLMFHIQDAFGRDSGVKINLEIDAFMLDADKAVAIGLIVNELATNSFKYAFSKKGGELYLSLKKVARSKIVLRLGDNGRGIKRSRPAVKASFGLKLVTLMARQLHTELVTETTTPAAYRMEIAL